MSVLHLSSDLMLVGKVSSWAKSHGVPYQNASTLEKFDAALAETDPVWHTVIVDLQFRGLDIAAIHGQVRAAIPPARLAGYAQHVMTELIAAAKAAGFDDILTRGQFDRQFAELMTPHT